jgi:hypothetical protein
MSPDQLSSLLRQIAAKIDSSRQPSRELVAADLRRVVAGLHAPVLLNPEDVKGLEETMQKLGELVSSGSASDEEIAAAIDKLQEVRSTVKRQRIKEQLDPNAPYVKPKSVHDKPLRWSADSESWAF